MVLGGTLRLALFLIFFFIAVPAFSAKTRTGAKLLNPPAQKSFSEKAPAPVLLFDQGGKKIMPMTLLSAKGDLYFLLPKSLYRCPGGLSRLGLTKELKAFDLGPKDGKVERMPVQEFSNFCYCPKQDVIYLLGKSGEVFSFAKGKWRQVFSAKDRKALAGADCIDIQPSEAGFYLLDAQENCLWQYKGKNTKIEKITTGKDACPNKAKPALSRQLSMCRQGDLYLVDYFGQMLKLTGKEGSRHFERFSWQRRKNVHPSHLFASTGNFFLVDPQAATVLSIDRHKGTCLSYDMPGASRLSGMVLEKDGFWVLNGEKLVYRLLSSGKKASRPLPVRNLDKRLGKLQIPIRGLRLPQNFGALPGAPRRYRFGVHQGIDFFSDCGLKVMVGTPVLAAGSGKIIRADVNYHDVGAKDRDRALRQCRKERQTSAVNEEIFCGRQVWIDHGQGFVTHYAHLSRIEKSIKVGAKVKKGDVIAFVGLSGTSERYNAKSKNAHLHFEMIVDGKYLGFGLSPAETLVKLADIFSYSCRKGSK